MIATTTSALLQCIGGDAELMFDGFPEVNIQVEMLPAGNIMHVIPDFNLIPLDFCALLTEEAGGFPMWCTPIPLTPWIMGDISVLMNGIPALDSTSILPCMIGGIITIVFPGNKTVALAL